MAAYLYLTLAADFERPALRDADSPVELDHAGLSEGLVAAIRSWNHDYQWVIPLSATERGHRSQEIADLDGRGLALCERIAVEIQTGAETPKVGYYSEGRLRTLL